MQVSIRAIASYEMPAETFVMLMIEPHPEAPDHHLKGAKLLTSSAPYNVVGVDVAGNLQRRLVVPAGVFSFEYKATFDAVANEPVPDEAQEPSPKELPPEILQYTLPSRYCQSDLLARMARSEFGMLPSGGMRVKAVAEWVRTHVEYRYGTTDSMTSAFDTATERVGVCRDFAHLVIAFSRALGMPARYVSAYALGLETPDFHGLAQVYVGNRWYNIDATFQGVRPALLPIAVGRDAADVPMATFWGNGKFREQSVEVRQVTC